MNQRTLAQVFATFDVSTSYLMFHKKFDVRCFGNKSDVDRGDKSNVDTNLMLLTIFAFHISFPLRIKIVISMIYKFPLSHPNVFVCRSKLKKVPSLH